MTRYPVIDGISSEELRSLAKTPSSQPLPGSLVEQRGTGADLDLGVVSTACQAVAAVRASDKWATGVGKHQDEFEEEAAPEFHRYMSALDPVALGDPDFWRWVALSEMRDLILWRNGFPGKALQDNWFGVGSGFWRALPVRMFVRMEIAHAAASVTGRTVESLSTGTESVGLWQDHLFAVQTGGSPGVVAALIEQRKAGALKGINKSGPIKATGKALNNLRTSVLSEILDAAGGAALVDAALMLAHQK